MYFVSFKSGELYSYFSRVCVIPLVASRWRHTPNVNTFQIDCKCPVLHVLYSLYLMVFTITLIWFSFMFYSPRVSCVFSSFQTQVIRVRSPACPQRVSSLRFSHGY